MTLAETWRSMPWIPDTRTIHEWASKEIKLPPVMGRREFVPEASRHFLAPMESLQSERIREVYILAPPRSGKTLIADCYVPWRIVNDPAAILSVFKTETQAELHCETRLMQVLSSCRLLAPLMPTDRHKKRSTEIQFANGYPLHVFGSSIDNLQARGYKVVILDECWNFNSGIVGHARARMGDFQKTQSNKFLAISQGGEPSTEWESLWNNGTRMEWHVPCAGCNRMMPLKFDGRNNDGERACVIWDEIKLSDGQWDAHSSSKTARFICPHCGHAHPDTAATRARWNQGGEYLQDGEGPPDCVGYHFEALVDVPFSILVAEWLKARNIARLGAYEATIEFKQKRRAMFASMNTVMQGDNILARVESSTNEEWPDEAARFMTVDVQADDMYWVMIRAWARGGESRRLFWGHVSGDAEIEAIKQRFTLPNKPKSLSVLIDSNWQKEAMKVYGIASRGGYMACAGTSQSQWSHRVTVNGRVEQRSRPWSEVYKADPDRGGAKAGTRACNCIRFSSDVASDRLQGLIDSGKWKEPLGHETPEEKEYSLQLHSEVKRARIKSDGSKEYYWHQTRADNHARDCAKMQTLAAMIVGLV